MSRLDRIRQIYQRHPAEPWDNLWEFGAHAGSRIERYHRFKALQVWAALKREEGNRDGDDWKQWDARHDAYRSEKRKIWKRIRRARNQNDNSLGSVQVNPTNWGGSGSVMDQFIEPFMQKRGLPLGSGKRTPAQNAAVGGSPSSDHLTTKTSTDARDFPTFSGEDDARALAAALGNHSWQANSYASFYVRVDGILFRVQILWGSGIGHSDHVHVGVSRA